MRKKSLLILIGLLLIISIAYLSGPSPSTPVYNADLPVAPSAPGDLEKYVSDQESGHKIKPDNEARIVWNDTLRNPTEYAIVYLHGFSASQGEGDSVHRWAASEFGCNLFLARLSDHGIDTPDALINLTADRYWESAKQALAIGEKIGKKVILMGTSTGGSLALQLAATYPDKVAGLVLMSPNIEINDKSAWILDKHWGLSVARKVVGSDYIETKEDFGPIYKQYWYPKYRLEGAVALQEYLDTKMNKATFEKVHQPVGLFYYYKDEIHQDSTVRVAAELKMFSELGTPADQKMSQAIPEAGNHVIGSSVKSRDVASVRKGVMLFMTGIMKMKPVR